MVKGGDTYSLLSDVRGSVRRVVDVSTGAVVQELKYSPFGRVLVDTNPGFQPFGYAGGLYDSDTGLVRFGARDYDGGTGRWTAKDPIGFGGGDANLYGYVLADPVNGVDPWGLEIRQHLLPEPECDASRPSLYRDAGCEYKERDAYGDYLLGGRWTICISSEGSVYCMDYDPIADIWKWIHWNPECESDDTEVSIREQFISFEEGLRTGKAGQVCTKQGGNTYECAKPSTP